VKQAVSEVCETMHGQESSIQYFVDGALAYHRVSLQSREEVFMPNACPFCGIPQEQYVLSNTTCYAIFDLSPVAPGHMLVIPKRHAPTFFDLTTQEHQTWTTFSYAAKSSWTSHPHQADTTSA
jgi:hypothetical protein